MNSIAIGPAPKFMKEDTIYCSYDGHYFYENYNDLIEDKNSIKNPIIIIINIFLIELLLI